MLKDVISVEPLEGFQVRLRFENGVVGVIDLARHVSFRGVLEPLRDPAYFRQVRVDAELGTIVWPNGADLDADVLYASVTGEPVRLQTVR
ncbi:MAG: hypothetical protein RL328_1681 [Acidobacteriota bacterium]|jgi:hypothetical protein